MDPKKKRSKTKAATRGKVWRISESAPLGEWVDVDTPVERNVAQDAAPTESTSGWVVSSFDLLKGTVVEEQDPDTIPDELFDQLFGAPVEPPKKDEPPQE
ncbi:hypothetical protein [Thermomonas sp.]|uniref:hypothetical protein n=1 Tax=Thermomonas sp. TaxID=1971895 RepID=UPI0035B2B00F